MIKVEHEEFEFGPEAVGDEIALALDMPPGVVHVIVQRRGEVLGVVPLPLGMFMQMIDKFMDEVLAEEPAGAELPEGRH